MTEFQKTIFNKHLAISRTLKNKPFKKRQDFSTLEQIKLTYLRRLEVFFLKYSEVNIDSYFIAPYKLYPDTEYFGLDYYASPRGIKAYSIYIKDLKYKSPDLQKDVTLQSLCFIGTFCIKNRINLDDYALFKTDLEPAWIYHLSLGKINCYVLMEFPSIYSIIEEMPFDTKTLLLGDFGHNFFTYKNMYNQSKTLKSTLVSAYQRVKFYIDKTLHDTRS